MATEQIPREAIHAYNLYIHGEIDRRAFFDRVKKVAVSTAAAAAIVDQLMPNYAEAQQVKPEDPRLKTSRETVQSPNGNGSIKGYLVRPASAGTNRLPSILVVHENRGLNPHIEDVTRRMALEGFMAFAPDGSDVGRRLSRRRRPGWKAVCQRRSDEDAGRHVRRGGVAEERVPTARGRLGATGFCYGGGVSNQLAVRMGADIHAVAPFYGQAPMAADVPKIKAAVLVLHGETDKRLVDGWPAYQEALKAAGVVNEGHIYPGAGHGFNNDASAPRYNKAAADAAWKRTIEWFNMYVAKK